MARTVKDASLETRTARARLEARHEPYWKAMDAGRHIGYRKGPRGGMWYARMSTGSAYAKGPLGKADDKLDADGAAIFSFAQAQVKAREWFADRARAAKGLESLSRGPYTVADAMRDYLVNYKTRGKRGQRQTQNMADTHILPAIGKVELANLDTRQLRRWHHGLATEAARLRSKIGAKVNVRAMPEDDDGKRRRRATANRILTVLKAALNFAWHDGRVASDQAWRRVKPFESVDEPIVRFLTQAESVRLVNAAAPWFRPMVEAAIFTGCRYGELCALRVSDFNPDTGTVTIRFSKSGKSRHVVLTDEARTFFADATAGRPASALIFTRPDGGPWRASHQQRPLAAACKAAQIAPAISFHILRHTHASLLANANVPLPMIAEQLGHADTRVTHRHYARLLPSYVANTIRASFPTLGTAAPSNVVRVDRKA